MSDQSQGPDWWIASDGRWYPPESRLDYPASVAEPETSISDPRGTTLSAPSSPEPPRAARKVPLWALLLGMIVAAAGGFVVGASGDDVSTTETADITSTTRGEGPSETSTSSTARPTTTTQPTLEAVDPMSMASVKGLAPPAIPAGTEGKLSVVAQATALDSSGSLALVVRNMTSDPVAAIEVTGIARDSAGAVVASGSSQGFSPALVQPGEIALGYVYFEYDLAEQTLEYELQVSSRPPDDLFTEPAELVFADFNALPSGPAGVIRNEGDEAASFAGVQVVCFDDQGTPTNSQQDFTDPTDIPPGGSAGFKVDLFDGGCAHYLAAAG